MTQDAANALPANDTARVASVGGSLRTMRQAKGWSLDDVSNRIKFSPRQLEALENEQWSALPTGVSLRGLIRSYARLLGMDAQAIVGKLDPHQQAPAPARLERGPLHAEHGGPPVEDERSPTSWGWLVPILLVVVAAIAYAFWQGWLPQHWITAWFPRFGR
jgi:cytoskeletal protein RodZ